MYTVLLVAHTIVILFLIGVILLQRPEGDGLGGLAGGGGNLFSGRTAGNVLTRVTAILAALFIVSSLTLAIMGGHQGGGSLADTLAAAPAPAAVPKTAEVPKPAEAPKPVSPSVPKPE